MHRNHNIMKYFRVFGLKMIRVICIVYVLINFSVISGSIGGRTLMEVMDALSRPDIAIHDRADTSKLHTLVFVRKQNNLDKLEHILNSVSDPKSSEYGKHWSASAIATLTGSSSSQNEILKFLNEYDVKSINSIRNGDYIVANASVATWEKVLEAKFFEYSHKQKSFKKFIRAANYSLPNHIFKHIHSVFNTVQLPMSLLDEPSDTGPLQFNLSAEQTAPVGFTTPASLNKIYNIQSNIGNNLTSQAIFGFLFQSISRQDLKLFQSVFHLPQQEISTGPGGHVLDGECNNIIQCMEATLDAEYLMAIAQNIPTQYYYWSGNDVWLDWILTVARMDHPPDVITISYGSYELFMGQTYIDAFNAEAMKLGVMGTTILAASGDDGVAGFFARILGPAFCDYLPMFPASSPYVTAIGGTMGPEKGEEEVACQSDMGGLITTGGGFSYASSLPEWQKDVVSHYVNDILHGEAADRMPKFGYPRNMRGYPDISLLATRYIVAIHGGFFQVSGTSAACPVMAGMISLVNSARRANGNSTLGWLNPALYALHPAFIKDITSGDNRCVAAGEQCCQQGFFAAEGWDPVTGLGSLDFEKFKNTMMRITSGAVVDEVPKTIEVGLNLRGIDTTAGSAVLSTIWWVVSWVILIIVILWLYRYCCQRRHDYQPIL